MWTVTLSRWNRLQHEGPTGTLLKRSHSACNSIVLYVCVVNLVTVKLIDFRIFYNLWISAATNGWPGSRAGTGYAKVKFLNLEMTVFDDLLCNLK